MKKLMTIGTVLGVALALVAGPAMATPDQLDREVYWEMPNGGNPENVTWPQPLADPSYLFCGVWYQVDTYAEADIAALTADGILTQGEDADVVKSWRFEYGGDCEPTTVTANPPTFDDLCGTADDVIGLPSNTEGITYFTEGIRDGVGTVTAYANQGYAFEDGSLTVVWTHEFTNEECPVVVTPPVEPPVVTEPPVTEAPPVDVVDTLPETGVDWTLLPLGASILALGAALIAISRRKELA